MFEKIKFVVKEICEKGNDHLTVKFIQNSEFEFTNHWNHRTFPEAYNLNLKVNPTFFTENYSDINRMAGLIKHFINTSSELKIDRISAKPDYEKVSVLNSEISIVETPWDEINSLQKQLVDQIKISVNSVDFQNIGNTSRTLMDKIARLVFDPKIHKPSVKNIDVSNGKFKNQLYTYISETLTGQHNKELRQFTKSAVDFTENAIDLMNQTTHKLDVKKHFAEVCIISTISIVSLIKAINEM